MERVSVDKGTVVPSSCAEKEVENKQRASLCPLFVDSREAG